MRGNDADAPCLRAAICYRWIMLRLERAHQPDLFDEDFDKPRVFRCVAGAFIATFNRHPVGDEGPYHRLSAFMPSVEAAEAALATGTWPPVEPEREWVETAARGTPRVRGR